MPELEEYTFYSCIRNLTKDEQNVVFYDDEEEYQINGNFTIWYYGY